ncbi:hypothetical protein TNCV_4061891 [Trichonephila clavipes]|nr:hypothetical protein TNCV_4061891 [Trichonephila clavipes]
MEAPFFARWSANSLPVTPQCPGIHCFGLGLVVGVSGVLVLLALKTSLVKRLMHIKSVMKQSSPTGVIVCGSPLRPSNRCSVKINLSVSVQEEKLIVEMDLERVLMEVARIVMCISFVKFLSETYSVLYRKNRVASLTSSARIICRNARLSLLVIVILGSRNIPLMWSWHQERDCSV